MIDLNESRRANYEKVDYWKRDEDTSMTTSELVTKKRTSGSFYATEMNPKSDTNNIVDNSFLFDDSSITLMTRDDVTGLAQNDIVRYENELWMVTSVQRRKIKKRSEFSVRPTFHTYISIKR